MTPDCGGTIYVLLPVHGRRALTQRFLESLARQTDRAFHVLLLDDGSTDGTASMARASGLPLTILAGDGSWWWAGALQRGYEWMRDAPSSPGDVVLIANDDTLIGEDFLAAGRAALARRPRTLLLAHRLNLDGKFVDAGVRADWATLRFLPVPDASQADCFSTRGLFLRREDFAALGGFRPRLLPHYLSDYEFTLRARRRGYSLAGDPSVTLRYDAASTGDLDPRAASLGEFLRRCFSNRFALNPLRWTAFVLLACPARWIPLNLVRVCLGFLGQLRDAATGARRP